MRTTSGLQYRSKAKLGRNAGRLSQDPKTLGLLAGLGALLGDNPATESFVFLLAFSASRRLVECLLRWR